MEMDFLFWAGLSLIPLLIFFIVALFSNKNSKWNHKKIAIIFMICIYFSNVFFMSSLIYFGSTETIDDAKKETVFKHFNTEYEIKDSDRRVRDSILYGLIYSTKMSGLGAKYQALIPSSFYFGKISGIYFIILTILTPIAFGGVVASFFEGVLAIIIFFFTKRFRDIYYFSDLNKKSMLLAKSIHKEKKHSLIVFCNKNKKWDSSLVQEAKYNGFIMFAWNEVDFVSFSNHKRYYFEMCTDETRNVSSVFSVIKEYIKISKKYNKAKKSLLLEKHVVYLFAEKDTTFDILSNRNEEEKIINIIILNRFKSAFYDVLLKKPLYRCLKDGRKDFSITIIGNGKCGLEILKACIWCTQLGPDYSTKINVIDKNATLLKSQLKKNCPEIISASYNINFFDCDVRTERFYEVLESECGDSNYITISTGYDDDNLCIAEDVRKFYRQKAKDYDNDPLINVFIENDEYLKSVENIMQNYKIDSFGSDKDFYSDSLVVESDVEKLAINSSCVYWKDRKDKHPDEVYSETDLRKYYYTDREIERGANRTNGIHLIYKLYLLGYGIVKKSEATAEQINESKEYLQQLKKIISEPINKEEYAISNKLKAQLARIEHDRWVAYYRSEGWSEIPYEKWNNFKEHFKEPKKDGSIKIYQKDYTIKQHVCICPYEKLEEAEKVFTSGNKPTDFREFDFVYINYLLNTLGLEKNVPEINISGVEYVLIKL